MATCQVWRLATVPLACAGCVEAVAMAPLARRRSFCVWPGPNGRCCNTVKLGGLHTGKVLSLFPSAETCLFSLIILSYQTLSPWPCPSLDSPRTALRKEPPPPLGTHRRRRAPKLPVASPAKAHEKAERHIRCPLSLSWLQCPEFDPRSITVAALKCENLFIYIPRAGKSN